MMDPARTRVLIVDDSPLFVDALSSLLAREPQFDVQGVARSGEEAVALARQLRPDIITMDLHMPGMDGLQAVERIMASCATPILVLTADSTAASTQLAFDALSRGALDLMAKPVLVGDPRASRALCEKLQLLASVGVVHHPGRNFLPSKPLTAPPAAAERVVGLVASTGGPPALLRVLRPLPTGFPLPILIVQHFSPGFVGQFAAWLNHDIELTVQVATQAQRLQPGHVYVAPDDFHMEVAAGCIRLTREPHDCAHRPSGDMLLKSLARSAARGSIGVVLTGMGADGSAGLLALREAGGTTIAQDDASSVVDGMPGEARRRGAALEVLSLEAMPLRLLELAARPSAANPETAA